MPIRIYNTLTKTKEIFESIEPGRIKMYVCGPTVYDSCHIGHARSVVVFDVIARYFKSVGYDVTYVRNFTDIDDKIINRANEMGIDTKTLSEKYIHEFYSDMDALNVERATVEPRATEHIGDIITVIEMLIQKNMAYQVDGDVFFPVERFKSYGKLSGRKLEDMMAGARVEVDSRKQNPMDFVLWKSAKPGEPYWESPWGKGRPGWHIECSAMSSHFLNETFDIHGGGKDLIFPHHENEIAQSEGAFDKPFAKYWIHNGFVNINKEKMSKSLNNFLMIKDVIKSYHPEAIRLFLLSNHYRSPIDFSEQNMSEAASGLDKLYGVLERVENKHFKPLESKLNDTGGHWADFCEVMDDDFNTARGVATLFDAARTLNRVLDAHDQKIPEKEEQRIQTMMSDIQKIGYVLGILMQTPKDYLAQKKAMAMGNQSLDTKKIEDLIKEREKARKARQWEKADDIRKQLDDLNVVLEDRPDGTVWKVKS